MIVLENVWSDKIEGFMSNEKQESDNLYSTYLERIWYLSISHFSLHLKKYKQALCVACLYEIKVCIILSFCP